MEGYKLFINGEWIDTEEKQDVLNKYTQDPYTTVAKASEKEVNAAIEAAATAYKNKKFSPYERFEVLKHVGQLLKENQDDMAENISLEAGKPLKQAMTEIDRASQTLELAAEEAKRIHGEGVPVEAAPGSENRMAFTIKVPVGVVGAISPFNFPVNLVAHR